MCERHRIVRTVRNVAVLALALTGMIASVAQAGTGYVIQQREGQDLSTLTLAQSGLRYDLLSPLPRNGTVKGPKPSPMLGLIIVYKGARLFLLDPVHRTYEPLALSSAVSSYQSELKLIARAQPFQGLPAPPASQARAAKAGGSQPARLRALALTTRIGPVRARAYLLQQGTLRERLWYAAALPEPPSNVRSLLVQALSGSAAGPLDNALRAHAAQFPLRIDIASGRRFNTVLSTLSIKRRSIGAQVLTPPRGYRRQDLLPSGTGSSAQAHKADVPADPLRCGILVVNLVGCLTGITSGPVSSHPAIYAFYWGGKFAQHLDYVSSINHALETMVGNEFADPNSQSFWGPLGQYGVGQGSFLGYDVIGANPDASVGSWNYFDIEYFVLTHRWGYDAPKYWWRWSDQDPIIAIFVDEKEVDPSGWDGYHAFALTEGTLLPFLIHPGLPFFIIKVPDLESISHDIESPAYLSAVDTASERASHEFVEAATDPYPFVSWADPLKEPIWSQGEIADICQQGNIAPWGMNTRVVEHGTAVQPFWSNDANACVPDARPNVQLVFPSGGDTFTWRSPATFAVKTDDMFDNGPVADSGITWSVDGQAVGEGHIFSTSSLSPGSRSVSVHVVDSQGGERDAGPVTINVVAHPPTARIDEPTSGASFGSDQTVNFRGSMFDPQQGDLGPLAIWSVDGTQVGTGASLFQYRIPTQGQHTITLSGTNGAGLSASASTTVMIGAPTGKPSVTITSPADNSSFGAGTQVTFSATATTSGGATVPDSGYSWSDDVDGPLGTGQSITHAPSGSICEIVTHHVTVTATDSDGRSSSDTITVQDGGIC